MIPRREQECREIRGVPRIRGDDPQPVQPADHAACVFPAYAGMIPRRPARQGLLEGVPRIRGDDPGNGMNHVAIVVCSPHTRG